MCSGRQCNITLLTPRLLTCHIFGGRILLCIFLDATALNVLQFHDVVKFLPVDTVRIIDVTVGIGHCDDLRSQLNTLLASILGNISGPRNEHGFARQLYAPSLQHIHQEVYVAVACGLRTDE